MSLLGGLMILAGVVELVLAAFAFVFITRLLRRASTPASEEIGAYKKVLRKVRKGEPMRQDELDLATQIVADRGSLLAFSIPAAVFTIGCFYVLGSIQLHGIHSLRIYIGLFPMLGAVNLTIQLLRVAVLRKRLRDVSSPTSHTARSLPDPVARHGSR